MSVEAVKAAVKKLTSKYRQIKHETLVQVPERTMFQCFYTNADDGALCAVFYHWDSLRCVNLNNSKEIFRISDEHWALYRSAVSPTDNRLIASTTCGADIMVCDTRTQLCIGYLKGHFHNACDLAFSPTGDILASASMATLRVWDMHSMKCQQHHNRLGDDGVCRVSFSGDGKLLAWVTSHKIVKVLKMPGCTHGQFGQSKHFDKAITSMRFSPVKTRNLLVCGLETGNMVAWDADDDNAPVPTFTGHVFPVSRLEFSQDGALLASACTGTFISVWDAVSGAHLHCIKFGSHDITHLAFNLSGDQLVASSVEGVCRLWTICEWSDRKNHFFGLTLRKVIYTLMCVKTHFAISARSCVPQLPIEIWLEIFQSLACFPSTDEIVFEN
jgi:WD40 repeat protein